MLFNVTSTDYKSNQFQSPVWCHARNAEESCCHPANKEEGCFTGGFVELSPTSVSLVSWLKKQLWNKFKSMPQTTVFTTHYSQRIDHITVLKRRFLKFRMTFSQLWINGKKSFLYCWTLPQLLTPSSTRHCMAVLNSSMDWEVQFWSGWHHIYMIVLTLLRFGILYQIQSLIIVECPKDLLLVLCCIYHVQCSHF